MSRLDVLIVEDDATLRDVLQFHFDAEGWVVRVAGDGAAALRLVAERKPDIVVLDLMLPGRSGIEICSELRSDPDRSLGIVIVTACGEEAEVVLGLETGADDYVVKPCRPRELIARVKAVARRIGTGEPESGDAVLQAGNVTVVERSRTVTVTGRALRLTPTEFALLVYLLRRQGDVLSRPELLSNVFGTAHEGYARNVDCHVARLRRKLEASGDAGLQIATSHGTGYTLVATEPS